MERWFLIRTNNDFFSIGAEDGKIIFAPDRHEWMMGKELKEITPFIKEGSGTAFELKKQGESIPISLELIFKIGKQ